MMQVPCRSEYTCGRQTEWDHSNTECGFEHSQLRGNCVAVVELEPNLTKVPG
jgi:hypothetical protein